MCVARLADAQAVGVAERRVQGERGVWVGSMPEGGHERVVGGEEGRVASGAELGGGPVEFEDLRGGGGEALWGVLVLVGCWVWAVGWGK